MDQGNTRQGGRMRQRTRGGCRHTEGNEARGKQVGHTAGTISNNETRKVKLDTVHMERRTNKIKL